MIFTRDKIPKSYQAEVSIKKFEIFTKKFQLKLQFKSRVASLQLNRPLFLWDLRHIILLKDFFCKIEIVH